MKKFVNESLDDIFKPKTKNEIFKSLDVDDSKIYTNGRQKVRIKELHDKNIKIIPIDDDHSWTIISLLDFKRWYHPVNESVEDILKPKSKKEVDTAFEDVADRIAEILLNYYEFDDYTDAYEWAIDHQEKILEYATLYDYNLIDNEDEDNDLEKLIQFILYGPHVEH